MMKNVVVWKLSIKQQINRESNLLILGRRHNQSIINKGIVLSLRAKRSNPKILRLLRSARNDNLDAGKLGDSDKEQLIWAAEQGRVIYSFNIGDFCRLHGEFMAEQINHAGIILVPQQQYSIGQQLRGLLKLVANKSAEEMKNQLVFLSSYIEKN